MNYPPIKEALKTWARAVTGLPLVVFQNDPQPMPNGAAVYLNVRNVPSVGVDDVSRAYNPTTKEITETVSGNRQLAVTFQVDSFDMRATKNALQIITRAQTRMGFASSDEILRAAGLALAAKSDPVDASYEADDQMVSRYSMDLTFNAVSAETDAPRPTIETYDLESEVRNEDGTLVPE